MGDLQRIYGYDEKQGKHFFNLVTSGFIFHTSDITFNKFFAIEVYYMFEKLKRVTGRWAYDAVIEQLPLVSNILKAHLDPLIPLPDSISSRVSHLATQPRPYQEAFMTIYYNARTKLGLDGYILAFDQGLGKTFTSIATTYCFDMAPTIITSPKSVLPEWHRSLLRMIPGLMPKEIVWLGETPIYKKWKYLICNYERLGYALEAAKYAAAPPKSLIVDESHNFRYLDTTRVQRLLDIKNNLGIKNVIAMSGTPIKALAAELIPTMMLIDPEFDEEARKIFNTIYSRSEYTYLAADILNKRLKVYIERKMKEDVLKDELPPKALFTIKCKLKDKTPYLLSTLETNVHKYIENHADEYANQRKPAYEELVHTAPFLKTDPQIPEEQTTSYLDAVNAYMHMREVQNFAEKRETIAKYEDLILKTSLVKSRALEVIQLRKQCTSYLSILLGKAMGIYYVKNKINMICEIVRENMDDFMELINEAEKKVIIFATYIEPLHVMSEELTKRNIGNIVAVGGTDTKTALQEFRTRNDLHVLLGSVGAIGTGTTITVADMEIFLNLPYRNADFLQAQDRIHRIGQDTQCKIYQCVVDTGDEPNLLMHEAEIVKWSAKMTKIALN